MCWLEGIIIFYKKIQCFRLIDISVDKVIALGNIRDHSIMVIKWADHKLTNLIVRFKKKFIYYIRFSEWVEEHLLNSFIFLAKRWVELTIECYKKLTIKRWGVLGHETH